MANRYQNDGWEEISAENVKMPEGYVGNLTPGHQEKLEQLWKAFFSVCDRATGTKMSGGEVNDENVDFGVDSSAVEKKMGGGGGFSSAAKAVKKSGIEQDDSAKDAAQKRMEEGNMEKLLTTYGSEALRKTFWSLNQMDYPDTTMLRFLRARKWDVDRATAMMASTLKWRLDTGVDKMSHNGDLYNDKEIPKYIDQQATGKVYAKGCNVFEQPVCYVHFKKHLIWGQPSASMKKFIICQMESWRLLFVPPNDKMVILFDCTGFGPSNLDMPNFLYVLQCLQSYFPECLAVLYLHNAPWILKQAWQLVKGLLDPVVRQKVVFTKTTEDLQENIPEDRLLEFVGGDVDMKFEWIDPVEGENDLTLNTEEQERRHAAHMRLAREYEEVTRAWVEAKTDKEERYALDQRRKTLAKRLRVSQFDFEPFWRGKTVHHRNGDLVLTNPGIVQWRYEQKDGRKVRQIIGQHQCKKTLVRELQEIEAGASVEWAEKRTDEMLANGTWGHWSTLDDLPPKPTGFANGELVYGGNAPSRLAATNDVPQAVSPQSSAEGVETVVDHHEPAPAVAAVPLNKAPAYPQTSKPLDKAAPVKLQNRDANDIDYRPKAKNNNRDTLRSTTSSKRKGSMFKRMMSKIAV